MSYPEWAARTRRSSVRARSARERSIARMLGLGPAQGTMQRDRTKVGPNRHNSSAPTIAHMLRSVQVWPLQRFGWSRRWDSNRRHSAREPGNLAGTVPLHARHCPLESPHVHREAWNRMVMRGHETWPRTTTGSGTASVAEAWGGSTPGASTAFPDPTGGFPGRGRGIGTEIGCRIPGWIDSRPASW